MKDIIRDAWLGQVIRLASNTRFLRYQEEEEGFTWSMLVSGEREAEGHFTDILTRSLSSRRKKPYSEPSGLYRTILEPSLLQKAPVNSILRRSKTKVREQAVPRSDRDRYRQLAMSSWLPPCQEHPPCRTQMSALKLRRNWQHTRPRVYLSPLWLPRKASF